MLIKLTGGKVYDPANGVDGVVRDIYVRDGRIVAADPNAKVDQEYALHGRVVMAGAIDPHTHIGGGKMTIGRMLMPEDHQHDPVSRTCLTRAGCGHALPSTLTAGYRYAEMGYTACFEPAMLPANARQAHMEMGDTPMVDKGAFVMLGSDDFFLRQLSQKKDFEAIKDYIAWTMHAAQAIARQSRQSRRHQRVQVQPAQARPRREARPLRRHAARHHPERSRAALKELGVVHPAAHPRLQSRRSRQRRHHARHHPRVGRPADPPHAHPVPQLRHRRRP